MSATEAFIQEVTEFIAARGMSRTAFGMAAVGDPNFVRQLLDGRSPSLRLVERARSFMSGNSTAAALGGPRGPLADPVIPSSSSCAVAGQEGTTDGVSEIANVGAEIANAHR